MPTRWNNAASLRRDQIESGLDLTFTNVFVPWYRDFLKSHKPRSLLEIGAGGGHLSRSIADIVHDIVAIEPSEGMYRVASETLAATSVVLRRLRIDELEFDRYYDVVLSHMCVQAVADLDGFLRSMTQHVAPSGLLVFSLPHPCFYNDYKKLIPADEYGYMREVHREISFTITRDPSREIANVPYCHRPISSYVRGVAAQGFAVEELAEIFPPQEVQEQYGRLWESPRYMVLISRRSMAST
jgi:SAM-dependent methyltransferase